MKSIGLAWLGLVAAAVPTAEAFASTFIIESEQLTALPPAVEAVIRKTQAPEHASCQIVGMPAMLAVKAKDSGYIATTAGSCGWGAAVGPIWVIRNGAHPTLLLSQPGYALALEKQAHHGMHDLTLSAATAGWSSSGAWKFDGVRYVPAKKKSAR